MKYFKITEFEKNGKKVTDPTILYNLTSLVDNFLDPAREYWGKPLYILEGYNPGSDHLGHSVGIAVEITTKSGPGNISLYEWFKSRGGYDELWLNPGNESIHISAYPKNKEEGKDMSGVKYMSDWIVCLDSGHGKDVAGKRSPDGTLLEWEWARDMKYRLMKKLEAEKICPCFDVNPEDTEPGLTTRATRANKAWAENNKKGIFVSIHVNAAGNGQWLNARGWEIYTTKGKTISDELATDMWYEMEKSLKPFGITMRSDMSDGDPDKEENFTVIYKTNFASVLVENLFMDNKEDVEFLKSEKGKEAILTGLFNGIKKYLSNRK